MTTLDYRTQVASQVEQNAAEQKAAANEAAWQEIIDRYCIRDHSANRRMVESWSGNEITLAKFKFLVDNPPQGFQLEWSDEKTLKAELIEAILQQLHGPTKMRFTDSDAKQARAKMQPWTLRMLRNRLAEVANKQYFATFSADDLKAGLREVRKSQVPKYPGFENLPAVIVPRGFVSAVSTSEFLKHIARHDVKAFRHYVERYGSEQINSYLRSA